MPQVRSLALASLFAFVLTLAPSQASTLVQRFTADPALAGWQGFGNSNLFAWDANRQALQVTWDSTQPTSYYYVPLGRTLTLADSFCVVVDLQLQDAAGMGYGSELAAGLLHWIDATNANEVRAWGTLPNVCEFDYFPPDAYGDPASADATLVDGADNFYFNYGGMTPDPAITYEILLVHAANAPAIRGEIFTNGQPMLTLPQTYSNLPTNDPGAFQLDTLAISSYTGDGAGDDILAHGTIHKIAVASPLPVQAIQSVAPGQIRLASDAQWTYTLEHSADLQRWSTAGAGVNGTGTNLLLQATPPLPGQLFYRVRAELP